MTHRSNLLKSLGERTHRNASVSDALRRGESEDLPLEEDSFSSGNLKLPYASADEIKEPEWKDAIRNSTK